MKCNCKWWKFQWKNIADSNEKRPAKDVLSEYINEKYFGKNISYTSRHSVHDWGADAEYVTVDDFHYQLPSFNTSKKACITCGTCLGYTAICEMFDKAYLKYREAQEKQAMNDKFFRIKEKNAQKKRDKKALLADVICEVKS